MLVEAVLIIAILTISFVLLLDHYLYPRYNVAFTGKYKLVIFLRGILPVLILILLIRSLLFEGFRIPSASMKPTLLEGDWILVDKYSLGLRIPLLGYRITNSKPQRGDVVVFRGTIADQKAALIKRIVGIPGDHILYKNRVLYVNGKPVTFSNIIKDSEQLDNGQQYPVIRATEFLDNMQHDIYFAWDNSKIIYRYTDLIVPANSYYVIGDYRDNSHDSRSWGVLADQDLVGKARLIVFSYDHMQKQARWNRIGIKI